MVEQKRNTLAPNQSNAEVIDSDIISQTILPTELLALPISLHDAQGRRVDITKAVNDKGVLEIPDNHSLELKSSLMQHTQVNYFQPNFENNSFLANINIDQKNITLQFNDKSTLADASGQRYSIADFLGQLSTTQTESRTRSSDIDVIGERNQFGQLPIATNLFAVEETLLPTVSENPENHQDARARFFNSEIEALVFFPNGNASTPVANDLLFVTNQNTGFTAAFSATGDGTLLYQIISSNALGVLVNHNNGTFSYTPVGLESLGVGQSAQYTITYIATNGTTASVPATITIDVNGLNDIPTLSLGNGIDFTAIGPPFGKAFAANATVGDVDSNATITEMVVTLTNDLDDGFEFLTVAGIPGGITVTGNNSDVLTLSGEADLSVYQSILRTIEYTNIHRTFFINGTRDIDVQITDDQGAVTNAQTTVEVVSPNIAPIVNDDTLYFNVTDSYYFTLEVPFTALLLNDNDLNPGDVLTITGGTNTSVQAGTTFTVNADSFTFAFDGNFGFRQPIEAQLGFTYDVSDGTTTSTGTVNIDVIDDGAGNNIYAPPPSFINKEDVIVLSNTNNNTGPGTTFDSFILTHGTDIHYIQGEGAPSTLIISDFTLDLTQIDDNRISEIYTIDLLSLDGARTLTIDPSDVFNMNETNTVTIDGSVDETVTSTAASGWAFVNSAGGYDNYQATYNATTVILRVHEDIATVTLS